MKIEIKIKADNNSIEVTEVYDLPDDFDEYAEHIKFAYMTTYEKRTIDKNFTIKHRIIKDESE